VVREEEDAPMSVEERKRNEDSFDLRSLALEDEDEAVTSPAPPLRAPAARPPAPAPAPAPAKVAAKPAAKDDDDLDALFDEIQIGD
jgi:hypothetical protein